MEVPPPPSQSTHLQVALEQRGVDDLTQLFLGFDGGVALHDRRGDHLILLHQLVAFLGQVLDERQQATLNLMTFKVRNSFWVLQFAAEILRQQVGVQTDDVGGVCLRKRQYFKSTNPKTTTERLTKLNCLKSPCNIPHINI